MTDEIGTKWIDRNGLKPQLGERSRRLGETKSAVYFFKSRGAAEVAARGWFGHAFPASSRLYCLTIDLPENTPCFGDPNFGEVETLVVDEIPRSSVKYVDTIRNRV